VRARISYSLAPDLPALELVCADYEAQRFRSHWHAGFTIGAVTRHAQGFRCEGVEWTAGADELIVLNPMQVHDGYSLGTGWSTRMVYLPEQTFAHMLGAEAGAAGTIGRFERPVLRDAALHALFVAWHRAMDGACGVAENALTRSLFRRLGLALTASAHASPTAHDAARSERLGALAGEGSHAADERAAPASRSTTWRRSKRELGLAPKVLTSQLRLIAAKRMLAEGASVVDAALECGYHDQSHFSREFAAAYGITAGQFRRVQQDRQRG